MNSATRVIVAVFVLFMAVDFLGIAYLGQQIAVRNRVDRETQAQELADWQAAMEKEMARRFEAEHQVSAAAQTVIENKVDTATTIAKAALNKPGTLLLPPKTPVPVRVVGTPIPTPTVTPMPDTNPRHGGLLDGLFHK